MFWRKVIVESHSQVFSYSTQRHLYLTDWEEVSTINYLSPEIANFNITPENPELSVSQFLLVINHSSQFIICLFFTSVSKEKCPATCHFN